MAKETPAIINGLCGAALMTPEAPLALLLPLGGAAAVAVGVGVGVRRHNRRA